MGCRALGEGSVEISIDLTIAGLPGHGASVRNNSRGKSRAIVAAETDEHYAKLGHELARFDGLGLHDWAGHVVLKQSEAVFVVDLDVCLRI